MEDKIKRDTVLANKDTIAWETDGITAQMFGSRICALCEKNEGTVYRKVHTRKNGLILENSRMYCEDCDKNHREDCDKDMKDWYTKQWAKCEATGEANWQKHGIYTNVSGSDHPSGLSTYFAYIKMPDGSFRPYRYEHPKDDKDRFDAAVDDEQKRLMDDESLDDEAKFDQYRAFIENYDLENTKLAHYRKNLIKDIDDHLARAAKHLELKENT